MNPIVSPPDKLQIEALYYDQHFKDSMCVWLESLSIDWVLNHSKLEILQSVFTMLIISIIILSSLLQSRTIKIKTLAYVCLCRYVCIRVCLDKKKKKRRFSLFVEQKSLTICTDSNDPIPLFLYSRFLHGFCFCFWKVILVNFIMTCLWNVMIFSKSFCYVVAPCRAR